jgi:hypothetical protein
MPHHSVADGAADATDDVILDASEDAARALLPVDERSPVIVMNDDWSGDWLGEYAVLLANTGGPPLAGIIVKASSIWGDLSINASGWEGLVVDARSSGLKGIPDVTASVGGPLTRPADGQIDSTVPNRSTGAQLIVDVSRRWSQPSLPVVVAVATELTDVADAYLIDPTVVDRVVVVASLGSFAAPQTSDRLVHELWTAKRNGRRSGSAGSVSLEWLTSSSRTPKACLSAALAAGARVTAMPDART